MPLTCGKCPMWEWADRGPGDWRCCIANGDWHLPGDRPHCESDIQALSDAVNKAVAMREAEDNAVR